MQHNKLSSLAERFPVIEKNNYYSIAQSRQRNGLYYGFSVPLLLVLTFTR